MVKSFWFCSINCVILDISFESCGLLKYHDACYEHVVRPRVYI